MAETMREIQQSCAIFRSEGTCAGCNHSKTCNLVAKAINNPIEDGVFEFDEGAPRKRNAKILAGLATNQVTWLDEKLRGEGV